MGLLLVLLLLSWLLLLQTVLGWLVLLLLVGALVLRLQMLLLFLLVVMTVGDSQDVERMGFSPKENHPGWMILTNLPIPPLTVRPSVTAGGAQKP